MIFALYNGGTPLDFFIILLFTLVAVTISLVLHEVAHGLVAKWNGDYTAKFAGRLTLNPLKHFDPIGFLMMMTVGFGYAQPVPVNPRNFKNYKKGMITVAIAGVVVNLILAFVSALFVCIMRYCFERALIGGSSEGVVNLCYYLFLFFRIMVTLNLSLLFFNILPIFPLDGFRVVEAFAHYGNRFCAFMRTNGMYILWGLVGLSFIVSMSGRYVALPYWFKYFDVLGTYLDFFVQKVYYLFTSFWGLMF